MQRYVNIERFETLKIIGVIIGTLTVSRYKDMLHHIQRLAEDNGQILYSFLVGKPNVAKIGNFPGIEGFILLGCDRSCFFDSHVFVLFR